ncbi:MAG: alpha-galactosidase [Chitinivibrionales bacterium]|nr:alpha-galactosidase [Chitinivibrionales bacterium]
MSPKIAFIGAGSIGFTRKLVSDLLTVPELGDCELAFTDISGRNLDMVAQLVQRDIDANEVSARLVSTVDRREALRGADYVFNVVRIGGLDAFQSDIDIPLAYGVDQCVGDTLCAGGIMYGQRGIAAMLEFCRDIREVAAPGCTLLNYANPNAMITWACNVYGGVNTVGLCHGVQGGHAMIKWVIERMYNEEKGRSPDDPNYESLDISDVDIVCAGINHQTWYIKVLFRGEDWTHRLLEGFERHPEYSRTEKVRIDMMRRFGYFSTESNGHLSEYLPWYRKRADEIAQWIDLGSWINGETGGYLRVCTEGRNWFETDFPNWLREPPKSYAPENRGREHGSYIVESLETGRIYRGHFNVINNGCISNLPDDAVVEVPGYVDRTGINIPKVGPLPLGCATVCNVSIGVQRLAVEAAVSGDDQLLRQAMMMDPLVGAVCNPSEIWQMVDEMLVAQEQWLPQYGAAIAAAKQRLAAGNPLPTRKGYRGAARQQTKTIEDMQRDRQAATANAAEADKAQERA